MSNETSTPPVIPAITQADLDVLKKQNEDLKKSVEEQRLESTKKITELSQTKATVEKRLQEINSVQDQENRIKVTQEHQARIASILEKAKVDSNAAAVEMQNLLELQRVNTVNELAPRIEKAINSRVHVENLKSKFPHLIPHEELIFAKVKLLQETKGVSFDEALTQTVEEVNAIMGNKGQPTVPTTPVPPTPPSVPRGEGGGNPPPPAPPKNDDVIKTPDELAKEEIQRTNDLIRKRRGGGR